MKISMWPVIQFSVKPNCLAIMQIIWHFKIHFWKIACGHGNHIKFENYFQSQNLSFTLNYFIWRFIWISSPCYWLIDWNKLIIHIVSTTRFTFAGTSQTCSRYRILLALRKTCSQYAHDSNTYKQLARPNKLGSCPWQMKIERKNYLSRQLRREKLKTNMPSPRKWQIEDQGQKPGQHFAHNPTPLFRNCKIKIATKWRRSGSILGPTAIERRTNVLK